MEKLKQALYLNLIKDDRWQYLTGGLKNTLIITLFATLIGIALGLLIAIVRATHDKTGKMKFLNGVCQVYLTVIRGTPVVIQLMIFYYCIFVSRVFAGVFVGVIAFGLNSAAYVAEIFRSGIMSIDGDRWRQVEALVLTMSRRCVISLCRRRLKTYFRRSAMSLLFF